MKLKLDSSYSIFQKKSVPKEAFLLLRKRETYVCVDCVAQVALEKDNMQPFLIQLQPNVKPRWLGDSKILPPNITPVQQKELDEFRERESWLSNYISLKPNSYFTAKVVLDREYVKYPRPGKYWNGFLCSKISIASPNEVELLNAQFYGPKAAREIDLSGSDQQISNTKNGTSQTKISQPNPGSKGNSSSAGARQQAPVPRTSNNTNYGPLRSPGTVNTDSNTNNNSSGTMNPPVRSAAQPAVPPAVQPVATNQPLSNPQAPQAKRTRPIPPPQTANSVSVNGSLSAPPAKKRVPSNTPTLSKSVDPPRNSEPPKQKEALVGEVSQKDSGSLSRSTQSTGKNVQFMTHKTDTLVSIVKSLNNEVSKIDGKHEAKYSEVIDEVNNLQQCVNSLMEKPVIHQNSTSLPENWQAKFDDLEKRMASESEKNMHRMKTSFKEEIFKYTDSQVSVTFRELAKNFSKTDPPESQSQSQYQPQPQSQNSQMTLEDKWKAVFKEMNRKINDALSRLAHLEQQQLPSHPPPPQQVPDNNWQVAFQELKNQMNSKINQTLSKFQHLEQQQRSLPPPSQPVPDTDWQVAFQELENQMNNKINETLSRVQNLEQQQLPPPPSSQPQSQSQSQPQPEVDFTELESRMSRKFMKISEDIGYMVNVQEQRYRQIMELVAPGSNSSDSDSDSD